MIAPFQIIAKPAGPRCNLRCSYCFYTDKADLFAGGGNLRMSPAVLDAYVRQHIAQPALREIEFMWQGGEPTLAGLDFFRQAVALQQQHAAGKTIRNSIQTNGTLLTDEWCEFLAARRFLVGISLDGPPKQHNSRRVDKSGGDTYEEVTRGLKLLQKHGVEFNTLTVVHRDNVRRPLDLYRFLKRAGSGYLQFIPLVERVAADGRFAAPGEPGAVSPYSVPPKEYGEFLRAIFDEWAKEDIGKVFVQLFDVTLGNHLNAPAGLCWFGAECGRGVALEHNGDVYSCDHYVYPSYRLGNILDQPLSEMLASPFQLKFGKDKSDALPACCRTCEVLFLCRGECPKRRFARAADDAPGLNYLCPAYRRFFTHSAPLMKKMSAELRRSPGDRPPLKDR